MNDTTAPQSQGFVKTLFSFPPVFWVANLVEVLERFAYYGIYFGFGIYMTSLGFSMEQLGNVQGLFLLISYGVPLISGTFADKYGFKKVLIVSYIAYLPSILLLLYTKTYSGIVITMLCIGFAAGMFKPLMWTWRFFSVSGSRSSKIVSESLPPVFGSSRRRRRPPSRNIDRPATQ